MASCTTISPLTATSAGVRGMFRVRRGRLQMPAQYGQQLWAVAGRRRRDTKRRPDRPGAARPRPDVVPPATGADGPEGGAGGSASSVQLADSAAQVAAPIRNSDRRDTGRPSGAFMNVIMAHPSGSQTPDGTAGI